MPDNSPTPPPHNWGEYRRHILAELERMNKGLEEANRKLDQFGTEIAVLKFKSGVWGGLAGLMVAVASALVALVMRMLG